MISSFIQAKAKKLYYIGLLSAAAMLSSRPAYAAPTGTQGCGTSESWLQTLGSLVKEPVQWIMYFTATTTVILLIWGFLMVRSARGRQDKVDKAMDFFKWFVGGSFGIFSASGIGSWFLGKFGCSPL